MIKSPDDLERIRASWRTVRDVDARVKSGQNARIFTLVSDVAGIPEIAESLLLVFGTSVLEDALKQLKEEGAFACPRFELKALMRASRDALPWVNFDAVDTCRDRRNAVAHRREFLRRGEYASYLDDIERELLAWQILEEPMRSDFTIDI